MPSNPLLTICCVTYNHHKYIAQAINSFLMQRTDFQFEILISDDFSNDGTAAIVKSFAEKFPEKITAFISDYNRGVHSNLTNLLQNCKGKYIALCEGDDYWTDPLKIQKQVDFLENNEEYIMCCHYTKVIDDKGGKIYSHPNPFPLIHTYDDLLLGKQQETKTATVVYRNMLGIHDIFKKDWFLKCYAGDKLFKIFATSFSGKKIFVLPEIMSCYRNHKGGIWSMIDADLRTSRMISDFNLIINTFTYPLTLKKKLLMFYIRRYLSHQIKCREYKSIINTVKSLS